MPDIPTQNERTSSSPSHSGPEKRHTEIDSPSPPEVASRSIVKLSEIAGPEEIGIVSICPTLVPLVAHTATSPGPPRHEQGYEEEGQAKIPEAFRWGS